MQNSVKILCVGDVVGKSGRNGLLHYIPKLKEKYQYDFLIVNVENTTHGNGLSYKHYLSYKEASIDVMTMGNHTFGKKEIEDYIKDAPNLIIPANLRNLPSVYDDHKAYTLEFKGKKIKVINLIGDHNMNMDAESCFTYFESVYEQDKDAIYVVDYHAELTAEKNVFGYNLDGKASIMYGTHTHVQTADERIMPEGLAYISDVGMCGSRESVIGYDYKLYVQRMWKGTPVTVASNKPSMINAILVEIDLDSKKAISIVRINENME